MDLIGDKSSNRWHESFCAEALGYRNSQRHGGHRAETVCLVVSTTSLNSMNIFTRVILGLCWSERSKQAQEKKESTGGDGVGTFTEKTSLLNSIGWEDPEGSNQERRFPTKLRQSEVCVCGPLVLCCALAIPAIVLWWLDGKRWFPSSEEGFVDPWKGESWQNAISIDGRKESVDEVALQEVLQ